MQLEHTQAPLKLLFLSPSNVRKDKDVGDITGLANSILLRGVLQNLGVVYSGDKDQLEVIYGGRRLRALHKLMEEGQIDGDYQVPIRKVHVDEANDTGMSLDENLYRQSMSPIDEFEAFAALSEQGLTVDEIAVQYGETNRHIKKRLAIGKAADCVKEGFRNGDLNLEGLKLFAGCNDKEHQAAVFETIKKAGQLYHLHVIRQHLYNEVINASSYIVKFVRRKSYEAAGGVVETDLFSEEERFIHPGILLDLSRQKLHAMVTEYLEAGWLWVHADLEWNSDFNGLIRINGEIQDDTPEITARKAELEPILEILEEKFNDDTITDEERDQYDQLDEELSELSEPVYGYTDEQRAISGVSIHIDFYGKPSISLGIVRPEDQKSTGIKEETDEEGTSPAAPEKPTYAQVLQDDYTQYRGLAFQVAMISKPDIASRYLTFTLALQLHGAVAWNTGTGLNIKAEKGLKNTAAKDIEDMPGSVFMAQTREALNFNWLIAETQEQQWQEFLLLNDVEVEALQTYCTAMMIEPHSLTYASDNHRSLDKLIPFIEPDMRAAWTPTTTNLFGRLKKPQLIEIIAELLGQDVAATMLTSKKTELVDTLHDFFDVPPTSPEDLCATWTHELAELELSNAKEKEGDAGGEEDDEEEKAGEAESNIAA